MKIGVITLDTAHLKTEQVIHGLLAKGGYELRVYALPFEERKARIPLIDHRPNQFAGESVRAIAERLGLEFKFCSTDKEIEGGCDVYQVLCGKLLSADCIEGKVVINCHSGVIPLMRGLDAFKWAIYEVCPLGVTLHQIDEEVDCGEVFAVVSTEVRKSDDLSKLSLRHYQNEIDCCIEFERLMAERSNPYASAVEGAARMRMPRSKEAEVVNRFPRYIEKFGL